MRINVTEKIGIPEGVQVEIVNHTLTARGPKGELSKKLFDPRLTITKEDKSVAVKCSKATKYNIIKVKTLAAHIKNILRGVSNGFEARLKICSGHFPMNVAVTGKNIVIKNFLGEKLPRTTEIVGNANVKVEGDNIIVSGCDRDGVGQTSANIEKATYITKKDRRVFMDGIFVIKKAE